MRVLAERLRYQPYSGGIWKEVDGCVEVVFEGFLLVVVVLDLDPAVDLQLVEGMA
jgi:hypothetical protein